MQGSGQLAEVSLKTQEERPNLVLGLPFLHAEWPCYTCLSSLDRLQNARQPDMRSCIYHRKLCSSGGREGIMQDLGPH